MKYPRYYLKARLTYSEESPRKTYFADGFCPNFEFGKGLCGGRIQLINRDLVNKGETFEAIVSFPSDQLLNSPIKGTKFAYCETPPNPIGEGEVLEVIGWVEE